jgi:hypothetical protein
MQYSDYINIVGKVSAKELKTLESAISQVPEWIMCKFISDGGTINITNTPLYEILAEQYNYTFKLDGIIYGFYVIDEAGNPQIWLNNNIRQIGEAVLHELGHYVDSINGYISNENEFMQAIGESGNTEQAYNLAKEIFADHFSLFIKNPEALKKQYPLSHELLKHIR